MQKSTTGAQTGYPVFLDRRYWWSRYLRLRPLIPREAYAQSFRDVCLVIMWCFIAAAVLVPLFRIHTKYKVPTNLARLAGPTSPLAKGRTDESPRAHKHADVKQHRGLPKGGAEPVQCRRPASPVPRKPRDGLVHDLSAAAGR